MFRLGRPMLRTAAVVGRRTAHSSRSARAYTTARPAQARSATKAVAAALIATGAAVAYTQRPCHADSPSLKEQIFGHYENRIREMSAPEKIFEYFASESKGTGADKEYFMTALDFVRAITPYDFRAGADVGPDGSLHNSNPSACKHVDRIVASVDQNADGLISFSEFIFFTTLLSIPPKYVNVAFRMFDEDGSGEVDVEEFKSLMSFLRTNNPLAQAQRQFSNEVENAGQYPVFFGKNGKKKLSYEQFSTFIQDLRKAVLHMQFDILTRSHDHSVKTITAADFASSLVSYANLRKAPGYLERVEKLRDSTYTVTFKEYQSFNEVLDHLDEVDFAINSFLTTGQPFRPQDLKRAAKAGADADLSEGLIQIVFYLFDTDGDGLLDSAEFVDVMRGRKVMGLTKPRDLGVTRFFSCFKECWRSEISDRSARSAR